MMIKGMLYGFWLAAFALPGTMAMAAPKLHPLLEATNKLAPKAPILYKWARAPMPAKRIRAALALGHIQHPDVVPLLMALLQDKVPKVRAAAAFGLGLLGWQKAWTGFHRPHILRALGARLHDKHPQVQQRVMEALAKYGPAHIEALLRPFLSNAPAKVQVEALRALFRTKIRRRSQHPKKQITHISKPILVLLQKLAKSPTAQVRRHVAYYFARVKDPQGLSLLLGLAKDKALWPRYFALFALRKLGHPKAAAAALPSTRHSHYIIRVAAIQAIAAAKGASTLPATLAKDPSFHVRAAVASAYGSLKQLSAAQIQRLVQWLQRDPYISVRAAALGTLARRQHNTQPTHVKKWLETAMKHSSWVLREAAVGASKELGTGQEAFLLTALKDKDTRVRAAAVSAMGKRKGPRAFAVLQAALRSPQLTIRGYATSAMTKRKEPHAAPLLWATYKQSLANKWVELREEIIRALAKGKSPRHLAWLKQAASDPAPSVANRALSALHKRGIKKLPTPPKRRLTSSPHLHMANAYLTQPQAPAPIIVIVTNRGTMEITTTPQSAPLHVANLVGRVNAGLYNGLNWHRVITNFVIQGGDPDGSGWGDGGYQVRAEINRQRYRRGTLGMPRAMGWHTGSVQLFFTHTPTPHLDGRYTVFGHITKGLPVLDKIEKGDLIIKAYTKATTATKTPTTAPAPAQPATATKLVVPSKQPRVPATKPAIRGKKPASTPASRPAARR